VQNETVQFGREWLAEMLVIALGVVCVLGGSRYALLASVPMAGCVGLLFVTEFSGWLARGAIACMMSIGFLLWWVSTV
jgi:hypothetical protein